MDVMIWVVTIALIGLLGYSIYTDPPSSGCLSADAAKARDEALKRRARAAPTSGAEDTAVTEAEAEAEADAVSEVEADAGSTVADDMPASPTASDLLRNPLTGEIAAVPTNYRFAKKWIKQALVDEGLLDKVYRNSDLDAAASARVRIALKQFKALAKYRA